MIGLLITTFFIMLTKLWVWPADLILKSFISSALIFLDGTRLKFYDMSKNSSSFWIVKDFCFLAIGFSIFFGLTVLWAFFIKQGYIAIGFSLIAYYCYLLRAILKVLSTTGNFLIKLLGSRLSSDGSESLPELSSESYHLISSGLLVNSPSIFW